jgi:hypothetical protein
LAAVGIALRDALAHLEAALGDVAFNLGFHTAPHQHTGQYHWHAHVRPNLVTQAGFERGERVSFPRAPEVCVEVRSPRNSEAELREKAALYFDAGAVEVWVCGESGVMTFWLATAESPAPASRIFPDFPPQVPLS